MLKVTTVLLLVTTAFGQDANLQVASIKSSPIPAAGKVPTSDMRISGDQLEFRYYSLAALLSIAYKIEAYQLSGPDWMATQHFDIDAKMPPAGEERLPELLQALLAIRFKLVTRRESKQQGAYALIVGKGGATLKESGPDAGNLDAPLPKDREIVHVERTTDGLRIISRSNGRLRFDADKISLPELALSLLKFVDAPVIDMTGLKGYYRVSMDVPPLKDGRVVNPDLLGRTDERAEVSVISIFASVQKLGLKLERRKLPIEHIVVDHLEKVPIEN
jgi:uncharacterized protein (TIGR03435 family)